MPYPGFYRNILVWCSLFELNWFDFMPIGCAMRFNFYNVRRFDSNPHVVLASCGPRGS